MISDRTSFFVNLQSAKFCEAFSEEASGDSRIKKLGGGHCGAKEKSRGGNINVSPAW